MICPKRDRRGHRGARRCHRVRSSQRNAKERADRATSLPVPGRRSVSVDEGVDVDSRATGSREIDNPHNVGMRPLSKNW